jgi:phosphoribosylformimino-5-aminoimidazole carboxamide ribonucleotide (ProFAR) isomerase
MGGTSMASILAVTKATTRRVTAAGGITTREEIDQLHALGVDAVVGMAIYTGALSLDD